VFDVQKQKDKSKKMHNIKGKYLTTNTIIMLLITSLLLSLLYPAWSTYKDRMLAHRALREAKNVQLSIRLVATEYYGSNDTPKSTKTSSGLKKTVEEDVLELAEADGEIQIVKWDAYSFVPTAFNYTNGSYYVEYSEDEAGESQWVVSKIKKLITYP
jgi:hypothetical protein